MANVLAVSITADVASLTSARAVASAELRALQSDLNSLARTAKDNGMSDALKAQMLGAGDAVAKARSQVALIDREIKSLGSGASGMQTIATGAEKAEVAMKKLHGATGGVTRELMVLVHEGLSGNYRRMAGSASILAQQTDKLKYVLNPYVLILGAVTAALAYVAVQEFEAARAATQMSESFALSGRGANETADAIRAQVEALTELPGVSRKFAEESIRFDAANAQVNERLAQAANQLLPLYIKAFGNDGPQAVDKLKGALAGLERGSTDEVISKFRQLNDTMLNLAPSEVAVVEGMMRQRDVIGAVNRIIGDLAAQGGGNIKALNAEIIKTEADLNKAKAALENAKAIAAHAFDASTLAAYGAEISRASAEVDRLTANLARLKKVQATPDHGEDLTSAIANSDATMASLRDNASKAKEAVAQLHAEMTQRLAANKDDQGAKDYFANQAKYDSDLRRSIDPGDFKKPKAATPENPMTALENQLRESELNMRRSTGEWLGDMSEYEARFWTDALNKAKTGKAQLKGEIQGRKDSAELQANRTNEQQSRQMSSEDISTNLSVQKSDIGDRRGAVEADFEAAKITAEQKRDLLAALAREEAQDEIKAQDDKAKAYFGDLAVAHEVADQKRQIEANLKAEIDQIERQLTADLKAEQDKRAKDAEKAARDQAEGWKTANAGIMSAENKLVADLMGGRKSLSQIITEIALDTSEKEIQADLRYFTQKALLGAEGVATDQATEKGGLLAHLMGETAKTVATTTGAQSRVMANASAAAETGTINATQNAKDVMGAAAVAAAKAYSALAGVPVIGPLLGAGAAAATFAAVEAYGSMASLAVGTNFVPGDMMAQIHAGERVVPAADNRALIAAVNRGTGSGAPGFGGGRGGGGSSRPINLAINALDSRSVSGWFSTSSGQRELRKMIKKMGG